MTKEGTHTKIHDIFRKMLECIQDMIIIFVCLALFMLMINVMLGLFKIMFQPVDFKIIASEIIFILVLIEVYRLLIIYLKEHRIAIDIMVEVGIVSTLREIILVGVLEIDPMLLAAISIFLISTLLLLRYGAIRIRED
ncbi:phosphate-starvation-inducible PsiE family protein [uncultured Methanomethylovorans sp.]|uniref:phosphate-starvation-inducible PsiE family protein n=1 Tax=uncultured Methanomethylovorans sp. TaxID=183759 RepID=UPI0009C866EF|nr:MAG: phosphate-starvation-inducible protein PsiE [Methanomethylovorans sp. PtaU1.Bin073]